MIDHFDAWERKIDEFVVMGGQRLNDPEMCIIALNMLPADTPAFLVQALEGHQDYVMLKMLIDKQVTYLSDHSRSHNLRVQLVDEDHDRDRTAWSERDVEQGVDEFLDLTGVDPASQDVILAVMKSQGWRGKVKTGPAAAPGARPRPVTPPRTGAPPAVRPLRCGNCGGEHATRDCSKPLLEHDQR
jgi:hypothetical protein